MKATAANSEAATARSHDNGTPAWKAPSSDTVARSSKADAAATSDAIAVTDKSDAIVDRKGSSTRAKADAEARTASMEPLETVEAAAIPTADININNNITKKLLF